MMSAKQESAPPNDRRLFRRKLTLGSASSWDSVHLAKFNVDFDKDSFVDEDDYPWREYCHLPANPVFDKSDTS
jgi:hypothetical protein